MKSKLHDRTGAHVAEVETDADDGVLIHNGRFFTPVNFMKADGRTDWDRIGTEYAEVTARVIACDAPRNVMQIRDRVFDSLQAQFQMNLRNVETRENVVLRVGYAEILPFLNDLANNVAQGLADLLHEEE